MMRDEIKTTMLFSRPEVELYSHGRFSIFCEIDIFNEHIMYFVREYDDDAEYDYIPHTDYEKAIDEFLNKIEGDKK